MESVLLLDIGEGTLEDSLYMLAKKPHLEKT